MTVDKSVLMCRDAEGKRIPVDVDSRLFDGTIKVFPIASGDFNKLSDSTDSDDKMIEEFVVEPKLSAEEIKDMPLRNKRELVKLVLKGGGLTDEEIAVAQEQNLRALQDKLKKN